MEQLIRERMGVNEDGSLFKLNPKIDDIPDKFSRRKNNIILVVMGSIKAGNSGCACPENAFVKNLIEHLVLRRQEHVVMDMEAGIEHFGRGTAKGCDSLVIVVEPSLKSLETASRIRRLAKDLGIKKTCAVGNKVRSTEDIDFIKAHLPKGVELVETIPYDESILGMDRSGVLGEVKEEILCKIKDLSDRLRGGLDA